MIQIFHNPRCGKSRECLAFIEESGVEFKIIKYLDAAPTANDLKDILRKLKMKPIDLVRTKEQIWIDNYANKTMTDTELIKAMVSNPILIERPIVINGDKAIIARGQINLSSIL